MLIASNLYEGFNGLYRSGVEEFPMSLVFALLRQDHIIFASDSRHVKGDQHAFYKNDETWKTQKILDSKAMLGFAGDDHGEDIVTTLRLSGSLENGSLISVAEKIQEEANRRHKKSLDEYGEPHLAFLVAGFENGTARSHVVGTPCRTILSQSYCPGNDNFEVIGRSFHGALYVLRKCAKEVENLDAGVRLAAFSLAEVGRYDTTVGGKSRIYIIRPNRNVNDCSDYLQAHTEWAANVGEQIRRAIIAPNGPRLSEPCEVPREGNS